MSTQSTEASFLLRSNRHGPEEGSAMIATLVVFTGLLGFVYVASMRSAVEVQETRRAVDQVRSDAISLAGKERAMQLLATAIKNSNITDPLQGIEDLFGAGSAYSPYVATPLMDGDTQVGAYSISMTLLDATESELTLAIDSTGYVPDAPQNLAPGEELKSWSATRTTLRYSLAPSQVFDYAYFINNWGWFYGDTIYCNGNARSNGQFDVAGYKPTITGQPIYDSVSWDGSAAYLSGYHDDNEDDKTDGKDGGIFSSWDILGADKVQGNGGLAMNQHDFEEPIPMPNLSNLASYEKTAISANGSISIGGVEYADAVYGDEGGEKQHLYLVGTAADPIVIDGPVVVRGSVLISGVVKGQGAIYAGGNVFVPKSLTYADEPDEPRPDGNEQEDTEDWLKENWDKDFLGLFARENIVVGDYTNATWQYYVGSWMSSSANESEEDAGADGIPNTKYGKDGIAGTADDDLLEGDGIFTVEQYSETDKALGLIPAGFDVGDTIPGTGEDLDGDGVYDDGATLADCAIPAALNTTNWGGNMPVGGVATYKSIASMKATKLDATFYTNHSFCYVVLGSTTAEINGALVSRNENIIYGTPTIEVNHDSRLLGSSSSKAAAYLPRQLEDVVTLRWTKLDRDPNRYLEID